VTTSSTDEQARCAWQADFETAVVIITRLRQGLKLCQEESRSVAPPRQLKTDSLKRTDSISQLAEDHWEHSEKVEKLAIYSVLQHRFLSSCCRNYIKAKDPALKSKSSEKKSSKRYMTQRRYDDANAMLLWIIDGLYEYWEEHSLLIMDAAWGK
jgi:hypothetical protein